VKTFSSAAWPKYITIEGKASIMMRHQTVEENTEIMGVFSW